KVCYSVEVQSNGSLSSYASVSFETPTCQKPINRGALSYDGNLKALAQRALSAGATVGGPTAMPYNAYELTVIDPNGFILIFSQIIDADRTFEVMLPLKHQ
ncbi:hypothetical protein IFO70_37245, partial [Phormidium tenue FACHB-886]|nr:hypothetical protein [Phormidium tenue FACHB-886]